MLIRWPSKIMPGTFVKKIGAAIDLLPTLAELAGVELIGEKPLDGRSLAPLLTQSDQAWPDRTIISHWRGRASARNERFRLDHAGKLFDIQEDPRQDRDVSGEHPEIRNQLQAEVDRFQAMAQGWDQDERPFLVGHAEYQYTQVPARDASYSEAVKRSNRFPNCSYLLNWTSTTDEIYWDVEVAETGAYAVEMHYACPEGDVGSRVELSFGDSKTSAVIKTAHDPPIRGGENDRVERQESYVKDFRSMPLGTIKLQAGPGRLSLRATDVPGNQVAEFRLLMFKRL